MWDVSKHWGSLSEEVFHAFLFCGFFTEEKTPEKIL